MLASTLVITSTILFVNGGLIYLFIRYRKIDKRTANVALIALIWMDGLSIAAISHIL